MSDLFDLANPVVRLCVAGTQAEYSGRIADAQDFYRQAWDARQNDLDACIAAHYVARHQPTPEETLRWNVIALERAIAVAGDDLLSFYPSLYLNLAKSHEAVGNTVEALRYYELTTASAAALPNEGYSEMVAESVAAGLKRASELQDQAI